MSRKPTSLDIAYLAGVSQATVSRALRGSPLVSAATRKRVQEVARQLNYRADRNAANLRSQKTNRLALLLFEDETVANAQINPFFLAILGGATRAASATGYDLLVSFQTMDQDWHTEYEVASRADGMILLGYGDYTAYGDRLRSLAEAEAHFVIWGPVIADQPGHYLCCDNRGGAATAVQHLLKLGRERVAFIGDASVRCPEFRLRYHGYCDALKRAGHDPDPALKVHCEEGEMSARKNGYFAARRLIESGATFDAVFAASDLMAIGAIQALTEQGLSVPNDVSVVGFDDIPAASWVYPTLTTVRQNTNLAGEMLVNNLIALIEDHPVKAGLMPVELIVRESCGGHSGAAASAA